MSNENPKIEVRDLRQGDWLWTHKAILFSPYIPDSAFKVYCGLASYADNRDQKSWPSMITLASKLHLSKSTVIRSLKLLEACGTVGIERRDGMSNMYSLLKCEEVKAPTVRKAQSTHHKLIDLFHRASMKFRGVKPLWSPKDMKRLKTILDSEIMTEIQIEQLIIYFLANPSYKEFSPSMSTFFSTGIFNGLMNRMKNGETFWKDLDRFAAEYYGEVRAVPHVSMQSMSEMVKQLSTKMSVKHGSTKERVLSR